jgi:hypothetical protein
MSIEQDTGSDDVRKAVVSVTAVFWLLLFLYSGPATSVGQDVSSDGLIQDVIEHMRANETNVMSVVIQGMYEATSYSPGGRITNVKKLRLYRFSRSGLFVKVERSGEELIPEKDSDKLHPLDLNEVIFYSPQSTVYVDLNQMVAHRRPVERPYPFPLDWAYGLRYLPDGQQIRRFSHVLESLLGQKLLSWSRDATNPNQIVLEVIRDRIKFRYWVDTEHGYLLVRMEGWESFPRPFNQELLVEKIEVTPKAYNGQWFIGSATRQESQVVFANPITLKLHLERTEEVLTISSFRAGIDFPEGELVFSQDRLAHLKALFDGIARETLELRTGNRIPWEPPTDQPDDVGLPLEVRCPPEITTAANTNCQSAVPDVGTAVTISPTGSYIKAQTPSPGTLVGLGTHTVQVLVTDEDITSLGACMTTFTVTETTAPQISCPAPMAVGCDVRLEAPVEFAATATDNCDTSPTVTCEPVSGSGFKVGARTVTCTAKDASGNTNTCTFTVTRAALGFTGFLSPIGGADATGGTYANPLRTFKRGSKIPVKFTLSCNGAAVDSGLHTLQLIKWSNETTAETPIDASPADAATTGNQFRWATDHWQYVLDAAATAMSVGTWELRATLSDGSTHSAYIALK